MIKAATDFLNFFFIAVGGLVTMIVIVPWLLALIVPLSFAFMHVLRQYLRASRQLKRIAATTRSPIFTALADLLRGAPSIRNFGAHHQLRRRFETLVELSTSTEVAFQACSRWLGVRLDFINATAVTGLALFGVFLAKSVGPGILGVALTQSLSLAGILQYSLRQASEVIPLTR